MLRYAWWVLVVTHELSWSCYNSLKKKQVCFRCEDLGYHWLRPQAMTRVKITVCYVFFRRNKDRNWLILWMSFQLKDLETVSFQLLLTNIRSQPFIPGRGGLGMTLHGNFIGWGKQCNQWPPQILEGLFIAEYCLALEQDR